MIKVCATGNDFLVLDLIQEPLSQGPSATEISSLCHRHTGFGADGFVILRSHPSIDFQWEFFNSDGKPAEMCGNAARAISQYYAHVSGKKNIHFQTLIGEIYAAVESPHELQGSVQVRLPLWRDYQEQLPSPVGPFTYVNTGVPHAVLEVQDLQNLNQLQQQALQIKALPQFQSAGVNVTFKMSASDGQKIHSITFERGVENFTLSCGTGAMASAIAQFQGQSLFQLAVQVPGGLLNVAADGKNLFLTGEGRVIGRCFQGVSS